MGGMKEREASGVSPSLLAVATERLVSYLLGWGSLIRLGYMEENLYIHFKHAKFEKTLSHPSS